MFFALVCCRRDGLHYENPKILGVCGISRDRSREKLDVASTSRETLRKQTNGHCTPLNDVPTSYILPLSLPPRSSHITATMNTARVARLGLRATQQFSVPRTAALNGLRTYATPAQNVKPPVALFGVDGTYATALVRLVFASGFSFDALQIGSQSAFFPLR
jgi:hypothetical protein